MLHPTHLRNGLAGGLAGGTALGVLLGFLGMLASVGQLVGLSGALPGSLAHLTASTLTGGVFGLLLGPFIDTKATSLSYGAAYGALWWLLCAATVLPAMTKAIDPRVHWRGGDGVLLLAILVGCLVYGLVLGGTFSWLNDLGRIVRPGGGSGSQ